VSRRKISRALEVTNRHHPTDSEVNRRRDLHSAQGHCLACSYVVASARTTPPTRDSPNRRLKLAQQCLQQRYTFRTNWTKTHQSQRPMVADMDVTDTSI